MYLNQFFEPCERLQPYVSAIYVMQSSGPANLCILPQPHFTLSFNYQGSVYLLEEDVSRKVPAVVLHGGHSSYKRCLITADTGMVVVKFRSCAVKSFFDFNGTDGVPASFFPASQPDYQDLSGLLRELSAALSGSDKVRLVEAFLCARLKGRGGDSLVEAAVDHIHNSNGNIKIQELSRSLYISESQFEKRFRKTVGIGAKKYASLVRINSVLAGNTAGGNITDTAYEAGYFDQAHFIRDFKAYTGYTPLRFFKLRTEAASSFMPLGLIESAHHRVSA